MELMPGYKMTEVGVIPEDWKDASLGELAEIRMCKRIFSEQTNPSGDIPFFKIGTFGRAPDAFISSDLYREYKRKYSFPKKGDVLLSAAGTLGRTVIYDGEDAYFQDSNIVWLDIDHSKIANQYLYQCYQTIRWASPEGSTISRLYNGIIRKTKIPLPPTKTEQHAIARVLSDVDALLATLDQMVTKKRDLKQAAMQQLLAGGIQLMGFDKKWLEVPLGEIVKSQKGQLITTKTIMPGDIPVIAGGKKPAYFHASANRYGKTITVSASGASAGYVAFHAAPIFASDCSTISESEKYCIEFIYYALQLRQEEIYAAQTGGAQPHIQPKDLAPILIKIPEDVTEQAAIASVLSGMDAEITKLEARRNKTIDIKQAMMQELLTGKTRLVGDEVQGIGEKAP